MDNGKLYRFQRRASQLVLSEATGTWPVFIADRGSAVRFRWSNLLLDVSRTQQARGGGPDGVVPPTPTPRSTGETGQDYSTTSSAKPAQVTPRMPQPNPYQLSPWNRP